MLAGTPGLSLVAHVRRGHGVVLVYQLVLDGLQCVRDALKGDGDLHQRYFSHTWCNVYLAAAIPRAVS